MSQPIVEWNQHNAIPMDEHRVASVDTGLSRFLRFGFGLGLIGLIAALLRFAS